MLGRQLTYSSSSRRMRGEAVGGARAAWERLMDSALTPMYLL